jgi:hypothetical protein
VGHSGFPNPPTPFYLSTKFCAKCGIFSGLILAADISAIGSTDNQLSTTSEVVERGKKLKKS